MTRLGEALVDVKPGFASRDDLDEGVFQFRMHNFTRDSSLDLTRRRRVNATAKQLERQSVSPGDVLFNATNSPELVGKSALISELDEPAVFSNHFMRLRTDPAQLHPGYLAHFLRLQFAHGVFRTMAKAWVNQATVGRDRLEALDIPLPPLVEQRRIAEILDRADALRTKRRQVVTHLDSLAGSVFRDAFADVADTSRLGDLATTTSGGTPNRSVSSNYGGGIPWVKSGELHAGLITETEETISAQGLSSSSAKVFPAGTVLLAMYGATAGVVGRLGVDAATNQAICAITPGPALLGEYLIAALRAQTMQLVAKAAGGAQPNLSQGIVREIAIPVPSFGDQERFATQVAAIDAQRSEVGRAQRMEHDLFASLQTRAFRGEL